MFLVANQNLNLGPKYYKLPAPNSWTTTS